MSEVPSPIEPFRPLPDRTWRQRFDDLIERARGSRRIQLIAGVVGGLCVAVVAFALLRPAGADPVPEATLPRASIPAAASTAPPSSSVGALVVVQAAGAVQHPGLYRLAPGSRVDDLVTAAGGFAEGADANRLNLASLLADGQKIYVPRVGEEIPSDVGSSSASGGGPTSSQPLDLNQATLQQLDALPGIGPATAQAILDYRSQHGRFRSVDDLLNVRGIGDAKLEQVRPLVRV
ncbi:MAG TPA: helix-hairpin-helix domain-containing protein [Acidimicrobiales bacterium]|nr:helix-hairpin-helix domain-containing protein [Acidimicrobiales bacterium]